MSKAGLSLSDDLGLAATAGLGVVVAAALVLLLVELRTRERGGWAVLATGVAGLVLFAGAVLRPVRVAVQGTRVGPRVVVLVDESRRLLIPSRGGTRRSHALAALAALGQRFKDARLTTLGFGAGAATPLSSTRAAPLESSRRKAISGPPSAALPRRQESTPKRSSS